MCVCVLECCGFLLFVVVVCVFVIRLLDMRLVLAPLSFDGSECELIIFMQKKNNREARDQ